MDAETAAAYLVALQDIPPDVLEKACGDMGRRQRNEYETAWPELATIRTRCDAIMRLRRELQQSKPLALTDGDNPPVTPEKWANFRSDVAALVAKKNMGS